MAEKFDPDKYLEKKKQKGFDPDAYLEKKKAKTVNVDLGQVEAGEHEENSVPVNIPLDWMDEPVPVVGGTPRGYIKGGAESLPIIGGIGGAVLGTAGGPVGTVGGAAAGGYLGKAAENFIEKEVLGEEKERKDVYVEPLISAAEMGAGEGIGTAVTKGGKVLLNTSLGKQATGAIKGGATKIAASLTGLAEQEIKTFAKNAEKIKKMFKDSDGDTFEAAEQLRAAWADKVKSFRQSMNDQISTALKSSTKTVDLKPITEALEAGKSKINAKLYPEQISQIDDLIQKAKSLAKKGKLSVSDANDIKHFLQGKASASYTPQGVIFPLGSEAAKAAKSGAAIARKLVNSAESSVAQANNRLQFLHDIEDTMNRNMLKMGSPEASIMAAGTGGNPRNAKALDKLGKLLGSDILGDAQNLAAMRSFGNPSWLPVDGTGKSLTRMSVGAGVGYVFGDEKSALAGAALT